MATLKSSDGKVVLLKSNHIFGRIKEKVNTLIENASVSKVHATINNNNGKWYLLDHSRNGTWLNGKKILIYQEKELAPGDEIKFSSSPAIWCFVDDAPPFDYLQNVSEPEVIVRLDQMVFLPSEEQTELTIFKELAGNWVVSQKDNECPLSDQDIIQTADGNSWVLNIDSSATVTQCEEETEVHFFEHAVFEIKVSSNEEHISINVHYNNRIFNLKERIHHYLFLLLARKKFEDRTRGLIPENRGWCEKKDLEKMLGVDYFYMNVQIHRLTQQFKAFSQANPYERQYGRVRIAANKFIIKKTGQSTIEYDG